MSEEFDALKRTRARAYLESVRDLRYTVDALQDEIETERKAMQPRGMRFDRIGGSSSTIKTRHAWSAMPSPLSHGLCAQHAIQSNRPRRATVCRAQSGPQCNAGAGHGAPTSTRKARCAADRIAVTWQREAPSPPAREARRSGRPSRAFPRPPAIRRGCPIPRRRRSVCA